VTRVAYWTEEGVTLSWARRLLDEGTDVLVYTRKPHAKGNGEGIVPRATSVGQWEAWGAQDPNTIWFCDCTDSGDYFDGLRKQGRLVVGGGSFMDRLENDRDYGLRFSAQNGIDVPPTKQFGSVRAAVDHMRSTTEQAVGDGGWAWKPNRNLGTAYSLCGEPDEVTRDCERMVIPKFGDRVAAVVQERVPGVALSTARWWNGKAWTGPYEGTIEDKAFMDGGIGPSTGCSLNTLWFYEDESPKIAQALRFEEMALEFRAKQAPPGIYDINAIVNERGAFALEFTPRLGIDAELVSHRAFTSLTEVLERLATGGDIDDLVRIGTAYHAVRVSVMPYPCEDKKLADLNIPVGLPVGGLTSLWAGDFAFAGLRFKDSQFEIADPYGFVGTTLALGRDVHAAYRALKRSCEAIDVPGLQYRTDGADVVAEKVEEMAKAGWPTTPILRRGRKEAS
jgi:phosphoribosylamine--glycine ligase